MGVVPIVAGKNKQRYRTQDRIFNQKIYEFVNCKEFNTSEVVI